MSKNQIHFISIMTFLLLLLANAVTVMAQIQTTTVNTGEKILFHDKSLIYAGNSEVNKKSKSTSRNKTSVEKTIIGHWMSKERFNSKDYETHYYISNNGSFIKIDGSTRTNMTYVVTSSDEKERWIEIEVRTKSKSNVGHDKKLELSENGLSMIETVVLGDTPMKSTFTYVDSKTAP